MPSIAPALAIRRHSVAAEIKLVHPHATPPLLEDRDGFLVGDDAEQREIEKRCEETQVAGNKMKFN